MSRQVVAPDALALSQPGTLNCGPRYGSMSAPIYGPAGDADATQAYLFQCGDDGLYAVSDDPSGYNIPTSACMEGWRFKTSFMLGVREVMPVAIAPEPILRGLRDVGYYVWREGSNPHGTAQ